MLRRQWVLGIVGLAGVLALAGCGQAASSSPASSPASRTPGPDVSLAPVPGASRRPTTTQATVKPAVILHGTTTTAAPAALPAGDPIAQVSDQPPSTDATDGTGARSPDPTATSASVAAPPPTTPVTAAAATSGTTPATAPSP